MLFQEKQIEVHCVKTVRIRSSLGPYFFLFGLKAEIYNLHFNALNGLLCSVKSIALQLQ